MNSQRIIAFTAFIAMLTLFSIGIVNAQNAINTIPPATDQKVLYLDDFEHGSNNWTLEKGWYLYNDGNNTYLKGDHVGPSNAFFMFGGWDNYTVKAKFKFINGAMGFKYRVQGQGKVYSINLNKKEITLEKSLGGTLGNWVLRNSTLALDDNWHEIEISGYGNTISVSLDNIPIFNYVDYDRPNLDGYFMISMYTNDTDAAIDDLEILGWPDTHVAYTESYLSYWIDVRDDQPGDPIGFIIISTVAIVFVSFVVIVLAIIYRLIRGKRQAYSAPSSSKGFLTSLRKKLIKKPKNMPVQNGGVNRGEPVVRVINHDVFISYSHEDKTIADALCMRLESQGIRCWVAPRDVQPGVNFQEAIIDAIDTSRIMVLIFTARSNDSPHVVRELTRAVSNKVIIIPFKVEDVPLSKSMAYLISVPHWLDAMTPPLEKHIEELVRTVQSFLKEK